jgi:hypothetical protein
MSSKLPIKRVSCDDSENNAVPPNKHKKFNEMNHSVEMMISAMRIVMEHFHPMYCDNIRPLPHFHFDPELQIKIAECFPHLTGMIISLIMNFESKFKRELDTIYAFIIVQSINYDCKKLTECLERGSPFGKGSGQNIAIHAYEHESYDEPFFRLTKDIKELCETALPSFPLVSPHFILYAAIANGTIEDITRIINIFFGKKLDIETTGESLEAACVCKKYGVIPLILEMGTKFVQPIKLEYILAILCMCASFETDKEAIDECIREFMRIMTHFSCDTLSMCNTSSHKEMRTCQSAWVILERHYMMPGKKYMLHRKVYNKLSHPRGTSFLANSLYRKLSGRDRNKVKCDSSLRGHQSFLRSIFRSEKYRVAMIILSSVNCVRILNALYPRITEEKTKRLSECDNNKIIIQQSMVSKDAVWKVMAHFFWSNDTHNISRLLKYSTTETGENSSGLWTITVKDVVDHIAYVLSENIPNDWHIFNYTPPIFVHLINALAKEANITLLDLWEYMLTNLYLERGNTCRLYGIQLVIDRIIETKILSQQDTLHKFLQIHQENIMKAKISIDLALQQLMDIINMNIHPCMYCIEDETKIQNRMQFIKMCMEALESDRICMQQIYTKFRECV